MNLSLQIQHCLFSCKEKRMKEIWEYEDIVVTISRNVDVLVSKLRKKLSDGIGVLYKFIAPREIC